MSQHHHLTNHHNHHDLKGDSTLHVIGVITNSVRYQSRYRLYRQWVKEMEQTPHVKVYTVEAAFGDRHHEVTEPGNPQHLQLRTKSEIWIKENLINLGVKHLLPRDWKYFAWVDCDISFENNGLDGKTNWALNTMHQLQHYHILQPWSDALDLDSQEQVFGHYKSFGSLHAKRIQKCHHKKDPYGNPYAHPGFAWAATRYWYENVGKLLEFCIIGAGDHHMSWGLLGQMVETIHNKIGPDYKKACLDWQQRAQWACGGYIGYTPGIIKHHHHGPKERRQYWGRWNILLGNNFNPITDLCYDEQGVLQLKGKHKLEQDIQKYNRERMEDSIESY